VAYGTKFVMVVARSAVARARIILDIAWVPSKQQEATVALDCFARLRALVPGAQGVIYDSALRGAHQQVLLRDLGLLPITRVRSSEEPRRPPRSVGRQKVIHVEDQEILIRDGSTQVLRLGAREGAIGIQEATGDGERFTELRRVRTLRRQDKSGHYRWYNELALPAELGDRTIIVRLDSDAADRAPRRGGPTWAKFLRSQAAGVLACDFFTVERVGLTRMYVLFFIELERRLVWLAGVSPHPTGEWVTQQTRNLGMALGERTTSVMVLIRDRDAKYMASFDAVFEGDGVRVVKTPVRAPRANAYAERWVRSVRTECPDWTLIWNRRHLERVLTAYVAHYNLARPHRGIGLEVPVAPDKLPPPTGPIERVDVLGGLIHEYHRAA
jgi:transposase InsO family protein